MRRKPQYFPNISVQVIYIQRMLESGGISSFFLKISLFANGTAPSKIIMYLSNMSSRSLTEISSTFENKLSTLITLLDIPCESQWKYLAGVLLWPSILFWVWKCLRLLEELLNDVRVVELLKFKKAFVGQMRRVAIMKPVKVLFDTRSIQSWMPKIIGFILEIVWSC